MQRHPSSYSYILLIFLTITTISVVKSTENMADNTEKSTTSNPSSEPASVYIVYTEPLEGGADPDSFHLSTLSSVLGSEDAAKDSLLYVYKTAATGFSAKLTPEQVSELQKKPGVLQVVPSQTYQLHKGGGASTMLM